MDTPKPEQLVALLLSPEKRREVIEWKRELEKGIKLLDREQENVVAEMKKDKMRLDAANTDMDSIAHITSSIERTKRELNLARRRVEQLERDLEIESAKLPSAVREERKKNIELRMKYHEKRHDDCIQRKAEKRKWLKLIEQAEELQRIGIKIGEEI